MTRMREEIEREVLAFIQTAEWAERHGFTDLALRSFEHQSQTITSYGAYARHRDATSIRSWEEIPPVPASAFRSHDLSAAPPGEELVTFETSGTAVSLRGRVRLRSTLLYRASLLRNFAQHLLPGGGRMRAVVFGPTREEAPRSSLWFMADRIVRELCTGGAWVVDRGQPRWERADDEFQRAVREREPLLLIGTTLFFQAYFERCDREGIRHKLPPGSRAMDTGGSKGASVEVRRDEIHRAFGRVLGLPPSHVVNEYGMAEMGSQFYEDRLLAVHERRPAREGFVVPPWVRTRALDPETMRECAPGTPGILVHYDLANLEIPTAIQTEDVGMVRGRYLELQGRLPEAERRGCSLPFEKFIELERKRA
jgi:hypothetical protein